MINYELYHFSYFCFMNLLKSVFSFYINSSIHVAIAVCALLGVTSLELDIEVSKSLFGFVFFGTITGYNFVKYVEIAGLRRQNLRLSLKTIRIFSFLCFGMLVFFALKLSFKTLLVISSFAVLTFLYEIPFLKNKTLRTFKGIKIFIVALVWAGVSVIIPLVDDSQSISVNNVITFIQRFFIVLVLTIPFEIRDLSYDSLELGTLPQRIGVLTSKILGFIILGITLLLEFFKEDINQSHLLSLTVLIFIITMFLLATNKKQPKFFASFWIESIPIVWVILLFYFKGII